MLTMDRLLELASDGDADGALVLALDKCPQFFQEFYQVVPDYQDGLDFADSASERILSRRRSVAPERFMRWDICLISLKLEMLDKLGRWEEYRDFFLKTYKKHPNYRGAYAKSAAHLHMDRASPYYFGEDEKYYYAHFLYLLLPRFEMINKVLGCKGRVTRKTPQISLERKEEAFDEMLKRFRTLLGLEKNIIGRQRY